MSNSRKIAAIFLVITVLLRALNPVIFKEAALSMTAFTAMDILLNGLYWLSFGVLMLRSITWQLTLRTYNLSVAYPFMSLSLIVLLLAANSIYGEAISWMHVIGTVLIICGLVLIAKKPVA